MGISQTDSQIKKYNDSIRKKYEGQSKTKKGPLTKKEKEKNKKQQKNVKGQGSNVEGILRTGEKQSEYSATRKKMNMGGAIMKNRGGMFKGSY